MSKHVCCFFLVFFPFFRFGLSWFQCVIETTLIAASIGTVHVGFHCPVLIWPTGRIVYVARVTQRTLKNQTANMTHCFSIGGQKIELEEIIFCQKKILVRTINRRASSHTIMLSYLSDNRWPQTMSARPRYTQPPMHFHYIKKEKERTIRRKRRRWLKERMAKIIARSIPNEYKRIGLFVSCYLASSEMENLWLEHQGATIYKELEKHLICDMTEMIIEFLFSKMTISSS